MSVKRYDRWYQVVDPAPTVSTAPTTAPVAKTPRRKDQTASRLVAPKIVAPPQVEMQDLEREAPREPLSQLSLALPPPPKKWSKWNGTSFFRPIATESAVFESMDRMVTIAGTASLPPEEICSANGVEWPCGMRARAAFRLWLRGRALVCKLPKDADAVSIVAPCRLGKQDVGAWLVSNGWARALGDGPYVKAEAVARKEGLGIFGEPPDTSGVAAVPPAPAVTLDDQPILAE